MDREEAEEFTQTLTLFGTGFWRQILWADKQGIPQALGLTLEEWVRHRIGGYIRLSAVERQAAAEELHAEGLPQGKIAQTLGVSESTVSRDLNVRNVTGPVETRTINLTPPTPAESLVKTGAISWTVPNETEAEPSVDERNSLAVPNETEAERDKVVKKHLTEKASAYIASQPTDLRPPACQESLPAYLRNERDVINNLIHTHRNQHWDIRGMDRIISAYRAVLAEIDFMISSLTDTELCEDSRLEESNGGSTPH